MCLTYPSVKWDQQCLPSISAQNSAWDTATSLQDLAVCVGDEEQSSGSAGFSQEGYLTAHWWLLAPSKVVGVVQQETGKGTALVHFCLPCTLSGMAVFQE